MDTRFLAMFLLFVIGCGSGVAQVPIALLPSNSAGGKNVTETVAQAPDPVEKPLVGNPIAPVQDLEVGEDPDLSSHNESQ